jgi:hypothetical protein
MSRENDIKVPKRPSISSRLSSAVQAIVRSLSPAPKYAYKPGNDNTTPKTGLLKDIQALGFRDVDTLLQFLNASVTGIDHDDKLLLEHLVQLISKLPATSVTGEQLTDGFINHLWDALSHPPATNLDEKYRYREPDGSNNNIRAPKLGAAMTHYARTTQAMVFQSPDQPDPGLIFDLLMARGDSFEAHPNGISSMLFYLASIIIHDIFQTVSRRLELTKKFATRCRGLTLYVK